MLNSTVTFNEPASGSSIVVNGANNLSQIFEVFDHFGNPIFTIPTSGGASMLGDDLSVFPSGDVFNPTFRVYGAASHNVSTNAGAFALGHGTGVVLFTCGTGAPSAVYPITSGIPANGTFYFNAAGGSLTTIYQVRAGAWVGIV